MMCALFYSHLGIEIHHGDAREILPTLANASVDLICTDPPFGHNNNNGDLIHRREAALGQLPCGSDSPLVARPIVNDGAECNDMVRGQFKEWNRLLKPGCCCCCCCCGGGPDPQFARWALWLDEEIGFKQMIVWDKGPMGMGWHYRRSYETVLVAQKPGAACKWYDETDAVENIIRPGDGAPKIIPSKSDHPTPKPLGLMKHFIRLHTQPGDLVCDPFGGGGTTMVAAKALGRRGFMVEIEEQWCEKAARKLDQGVLAFTD